MSTRSLLTLAMFALFLICGRTSAEQAAPQNKPNLITGQAESKTKEARVPKSAQTKAGSGTPDRQKEPDQTRSALVIKLKASREQPAAGSDFGISADIENTSDQAVYLNPQGLTMTAPPELDPGGPRDWWAWLPGTYVGTGEPSPNEAQKQGGTEDQSSDWDKVVVIAPHSKMSAFWAANLQPQQKVTKSELFLRNLLFPPGKYTINVVGSYWDTIKGAMNKTPEHRTEIASIDLPIVAPQSTLLFGAALGGLFAFFLIPRTTKYPVGCGAGRKLAIDTGHLISAVLLSVIVTILLARLSETQFLIKISINDLWGAITVGFVVGASGIKILKTLKIGGAEGSEVAHPSTPAETTIATAGETKPAEARMPATAEAPSPKSAGAKIAAAAGTKSPKPAEELGTPPFGQVIKGREHAAQQPSVEVEEDLVAELKK